MDPLKLYISANDKYDQNHYKSIIRDHGIDIQIADDIMDVTHYYYDSDNDNNDIKLEEQKMNSNWQLLRDPNFKFTMVTKVLGHENEDGYNSVKDWLWI